MARLPRFSLPGQPQHVIQRGNNRNEVFCAEDDYRFFLDKLRLAAEKHGCAIHAYVLMTNHVHLLLSPDSPEGIGKCMQSLGRYYVQYFNHTLQPHLSPNRNLVGGPLSGDAHHSASPVPSTGSQL